MRVFGQLLRPLSTHSDQTGIKSGACPMMLLLGWLSIALQKQSTTPHASASVSGVSCAFALKCATTIIPCNRGGLAKRQMARLMTVYSGGIYSLLCSSGGALRTTLWKSKSEFTMTRIGGQNGFVLERDITWRSQDKFSFTG